MLYLFLIFNLFCSIIANLISKIFQKLTTIKYTIFYLILIFSICIIILLYSLFINFFLYWEKLKKSVAWRMSTGSVRWAQGGVKYHQGKKSEHREKWSWQDYIFIKNITWKSMGNHTCRARPNPILGELRDFCRKSL